MSTQSDDDLIYDTQVAAAVADFQSANGLAPSGILTPRTQASLAGDEPKPDVGNDIIANMEIWRWMPRDLGQNRIDVNIPDYEVRVFRDDEVVQENKVVVGKPTTPTPVFSNTMKFVIINPYWNVPPSILRKEMLPHLARDPDYLQRMGFEAFYFHGHLDGAPAAGRKECAGPHQVHVPQSILGLSPRHAREAPLRVDETRLQPRLRARRSAARFRRRQCSGRNGRKTASKA